jgi:error-prone DNA polymerase
MVDYVELHCHSCFSLLGGASSPKALVKQAADLGMTALALTDHDAVYGAAQFVQLAQKHNIKPILGAELTLHDQSHLTLLVKDETGWENLCALITTARRNAAKGESLLPRGALSKHTDGLIALSGCSKGAISTALLRGDPDTATTIASHLASVFGRENFYIELQHHLLPDDNTLVNDLVDLARQLDLPIVATNNVHYAQQDGHRLLDVLTCIRHNTSLDEAGALLRSNSEYYLKSAKEIQALFADYPDAITNTVCIAERCNFHLHYGLQELPQFPTDNAKSADAMLRDLCKTGLRQRNIPLSSTVRERLTHELRVIQQSGLSNYFLVVWDIVRFSRENGILCQGRGSAANSLVTFLLGIAPINPMDHALVFGRFLSEERQVVPDIDIDFQADRREEVIQYVYNRYSHDHAAMVCTLVTFRARSAMRDVGKALGLPLDWLNQASRSLDTRKPDELEQSRSLQDTLGSRISSQQWQLLLDLCQQIDGFPRHLGVHNGGMIITGAPIFHRVAVEPATMPDRYVTQWDKESLEDAGLVKIDILGLRILSVVAETVDLVEETAGKRPNLEALRFDDPAIYTMMTNADTVGVFQVESRNQTQMLPRLKPRHFGDLIVGISLIRPGPIQGNMVHPYMRRRLGEEPVTYLHPLLEPALKETLGVILFQEQVLKVARDLAGFTAGQGELLRRALGSKNPGQQVEQLHEAFIIGAQKKGVSPEIAEGVFEKLKAFGGYSFPKSHAASFAVLVYRSGWLKRYHPLPFYTALLNHQPMGFWSPAVIVNDAKRHDIQTLSVNINRSPFKCTIEQGRIRLGFNYVKGINEVYGERLVEARADTPFKNLTDCCQRSQLPRRLIENLIQSGAMDSWGERRDLLWKLGTITYQVNELELDYVETQVNLPSLSDWEAEDMQMGMTGVTLGDHIMARLRPNLQRRGILSSHQLLVHPSAQKVWAAGLMVVHQAPPTAKGHRFITLEDEWGFINVIVRPVIYAQFRPIVHNASLLLVEGVTQHKDGVTNLIALQFRALVDEIDTPPVVV